MPPCSCKPSVRDSFCWLYLLATLIGTLALPLKLEAQPGQTLQSAPVQEGQTQTAGYPVTGRVVCADTQRPARFANVALIPAEEGGGQGRGGGRASARTDLDGNFVIPNVTPGDYYVTAQLTGYINQAPAVLAALNADSSGSSASSAATPSIPADVPKIRVTAGGASAQLSLQRGGVLGGMVQWDDGSPAAGVQISLAAPPSQGANSSSGLPEGFGNRPFSGGLFAAGQTDDRGRFRLSGIAAGSYLLRASVQAPAPASALIGDRRGFARTLNLSVYAPDKVRRTDATIFKLAAGEERSDINMVLNLNGLHSVSGTVASSSAPVRSGSISLTDQSDSSLSRFGTVNADGTFLVPYVPPGNYTLRANVSAQAPSYGRGSQGASASSSVRFQPLQESLTVTDSDLAGLSLTVTVATAGNSAQ